MRSWLTTGTDNKTSKRKRGGGVGSI